MLGEIFRDGRDIVWKWFNHSIEGTSKNSQENGVFFLFSWVLPATLVTIIGLWTISGLFGGIFSTVTNATVSLGMGGLGYCQTVSQPSGSTVWSKCETK